jgi:HlyD family secretion protein
MKKSRWRHLKNKWVLTAIAIVVIIIVFVWYRRGNTAPTFEWTAAEVGNVIETVSVTGTVSPIGKAGLSFEKGGVITKIYVKVGDAVRVGDPIASLDSANDRAALASAQATLADMSRSLTPQELAVQHANVDIAKVSLDNAARDAVNAFHDGYVKAQGAVVNYADSLFTNPQSANPTIDIRTESAVQQSSINAERVAISDTLNNWSAELATASTSNAAGVISDARGYLLTVKSFMNDLAPIVNGLNPGNSGLSQSAINAYVAAMNSGLTALNAAVDSVTAAQTGLSAAKSAYDQAVSNYNLKLSGNSGDSIAAQAAKVAQAQAQLAQDTILSPIDGIVTQADPNVGEYVAPGQSGFAVQNDSFKIEAFVPEADIAKVAVGNLASSTLDAYGSYVDFPERVIMIDPAETVIEGVPTYKVTLVFVSPDSRIRSGMTSNLEIHTHEADNVVEIPYRALASTATTTTVRVVSLDGKTYSIVPVVTGLKGSDGTIEIISGLNPGDKVVTYVK